VRRGSLQLTLLLTGELQAARSEVLSVPPSPSFQVTIQWLAEDGATVAAGDPVVRFEQTSSVSRLDDKRAAVAAAAGDLARVTAEGRTAEAEKRFAVAQAEIDLAKARRAASVPPELLPGREVQDRQLALARAEAALAKGRDALAAAEAGAAADVELQRLALAKAEREVAVAEQGIRGLTVAAPRAGMVLVGELPWEGRKLRKGDAVWPGMTVATLPDAAVTRVAAELSDVDDGQVAPGMAVTCYLDAYPRQGLAGRVLDVGAVARESGRTAVLRTLPVTIALAPPPAGVARRLRPGMSARVEIATRTVRDALLVPRLALDLAAAPPRVRLAGGGTAAVRLGACDAFRCVAESGVAEGERLGAWLPAAGGDGAAGDAGR
jgi:HlyD family secretion protein